MKVQIYCLIYGINTLTMEDKHFRKLDSWFFQRLRRAIGIKASYYSHVTNKSVWIQTHRPLLPSQIVLSQQFELLAEPVRAPGDQPLHHVAHGPALKDKVAQYKNHKAGPPPPHWLLLVSNHALEDCRSETPNMDLLTLQKLIRKEHDFPARLVAAPTRHPFKFRLFAQSIGSAWQSQKKTLTGRGWPAVIVARSRVPCRPYLTH